GFFAASAKRERRTTARCFIGGDSRGTDTPRYHRDVDSEVVEVLKEIRDGVRGTNARLETVESRIQFVEKRLKSGFTELSQKIETVAKKQLEAEMHVVTELVSVADVLRSGTATRKADQQTVRALEKRVGALEKRRR